MWGHVNLLAQMRSNPMSAVKIQNFEGPLDLLLQLVIKNKMSIHDVPLEIVADQYISAMDAMTEMDLDITSEFLVIASTLMLIKTRALLPSAVKQEDEDMEEVARDLREALSQYAMFKGAGAMLDASLHQSFGSYYKDAEPHHFNGEDTQLELSFEMLNRVFRQLVHTAVKKVNQSVKKSMHVILQLERVSVREMARYVLTSLSTGRSSFATLGKLFAHSRLELITCFLSILELAKVGKIAMVQEHPFGDIQLELSLRNNPLDIESVDAILESIQDSSEATKRQDQQLLDINVHEFGGSLDDKSEF
jgi:segregation and condensation protein A